jgi:hypothetical protein
MKLVDIGGETYWLLDDFTGFTDFNMSILELILHAYIFWFNCRNEIRLEKSITRVWFG